MRAWAAWALAVALFAAPVSAAHAAPQSPGVKTGSALKAALAPGASESPQGGPAEPAALARAEKAGARGTSEKPVSGVTKGAREAKPFEAEIHQAEPTKAQGSGPEVTSQDYVVAAGDHLEIIVYPEEDLNRTLEVSKTGEISFPLLGKVSVAGLKVHDVEQKVQSLLEADYLVSPVVTVRVAQYHSRIVVVLGEVKRPGTYDFASEERLTLMGAVAMAGGFTDLAAVSKVKVVRVREGKEQTLLVNASDILNGKAKDLDLEPNDLVIVPESFF